MDEGAQAPIGSNRLENVSALLSTCVLSAGARTCLRPYMTGAPFCLRPYMSGAPFCLRPYMTGAPFCLRPYMTGAHFYLRPYMIGNQYPTLKLNLEVLNFVRVCNHKCNF